MDTTVHAHIPPRARVVVAAQPARHAHAIRQLRRALPGRQVDVVDSGVAVASGDADLLVALADPATPAPAALATPEEIGVLPEDGLLLRSGAVAGRPAVVAAGGGVPGVIHAVHELTRRLSTPSGDDLALPAVDLRQTPSLPYRLFWTWDHSTNWYLEQSGLQDIGALNYYAKPSEGFLQDYTRLVDFMSLHRIGGVTIYGFLRDSHGGVEAAQELCRYANERGVRIIPGIGINSYGGIYWEGNHRYNLTAWLRQHPELRAVMTEPPTFDIPDFPQLMYPETPYADAACPSKPENARFHEEAIAWLAETFEIGGINYEMGDYGACSCADCAARRAGNANWAMLDMQLLLPRLFDAARRIRPDLWLIDETYNDAILDLNKLEPLRALPDDVIYQFTVTKSYWPKVQSGLTREHVARLPHSKNVLNTLMGSQWQGERYAPVARRWAELTQLVAGAGMQGATIWGEVSAFSTVNEINYLAFARFAYDGSLTWDRFLTEDLGPLLGGAEAAARYLDLLEIPSETRALAHAAGEARELAAAQSGDAYRRWVWLQNRLHRQQAMMPA
ncbi:MAG: hypothetical protein K0Q89_523 [Thermomicrobiales bacterium]|nr:hypothetical protein [Thermomicrobiales bacterium]